MRCILIYALYFVMGLHLEELIYGGAYVRTTFNVSSNVYCRGGAYIYYLQHERPGYKQSQQATRML
jgi:hypothetical protein